MKEARNYGHGESARLPKSTASDRTGEKRVSVPREDREYGGAKSATGAHAPKRATASDTSGERHVHMAGGVGMGKMDSIGARPSHHLGHHDGHMGEMKGHHEGHVYEHVRGHHDQDSM